MSAVTANEKMDQLNGTKEQLPTPPPLPVNSIVDSNEDGIKEYLTKLRWPVGLQKILLQGVKAVPMKFFVCDDSGTMMLSDGHKVVADGKILKLVSCSRWSEMTESLRFHIDLAIAAKSPTEFRLLNVANAITVGISPEKDEINKVALEHNLDLYVGSTPAKQRIPLSYHVNQIAAFLETQADKLRAKGHKAALVILTDGEATDGDIVTTLRRLKNLPVWVVIRLCTDDPKMVTYWNNVDSEVELNMDVIDDPLGEAKEIYRLNRWLTYGEPLHRLREFGVTAKEMDLIDEVQLTKAQMKSICCSVLDVDPLKIPDPETHWNEFLNEITKANDIAPQVWNPITKKLEKWIDIKNLDRSYNLDKGDCCSLS